MIRHRSSRERRDEFEALALPHMDSLYSTALRLSKNQLDAEDLVQDTCLRAYRFYDKFAPGTNFKAWLFKILTNTFINKYRKKQREPQKVEFDKVEFSYSEDDDRQEAARGFVEIDTRIHDTLFDDRIKDAIDRLPLDFRTVLILCDIHGFAYKEIAGMVNTPIGTVMSRLSRARRQMQKYLEDYAIREGYIKRKK